MALRSQRSGNASWPRNRSASTEDGELDRQEAMENSNVDQVQQVDHWNSRSLYNSNMVAILTLVLYLQD